MNPQYNLSPQQYQQHLQNTQPYATTSPNPSYLPSTAPGKDGMEEYEEIREQDRFLPIANIARIMKNTLPENAKIAKDAKETVQECVSEFISFITSEASDKCMHEKRKTINGDDLLWAMSTLGFDKYVEPLKVYLAKYREAVKGEKPEKGKEDE
ncbi:hypothetical protein TrVE_jg8628 [Triparma verrucosa]|uniref:Transcription factor CBF/NF-Y/archaeal histone domain-containing protein n=2 Tax=Triparma TaxID=722752 RepID=A0A9W7BEB6_9STRA|nr:hypothetical protein TrST_g3653 [Triparma strigata]GMI11774.1 hypothetical protein TrVE_jg8628 [Triparma verrucosa]|eukprot:CAMPEP_0182499428 /NCGR_PEP_ID=MMETSP1321-20130603/7672_1 /TAXON_ID=91990 /ORGANISM="Bolidomonas sp., Strain RCC1657" /LENGTH=153 /DNA_ID=CAMNT_0024703629 /DNA_START=123 /DNA_END=584 /DNA_ORIENTATION=+